MSGGSNNSFFNNNAPIRDYRQEALRARSIPILCPLCKKRGRYGSNIAEVGRRLPHIIFSGVAYCHRCNRNALMIEDGLRSNRIWYCERCEICLCCKCDTLTKEENSVAIIN